jgi:prepilin-type processing-associated H-X9-DG protein
MKTSFCTQPPAGDRAGFTKTELIMIIAVVALLAAFHLYAANGQKNQSKIVQCGCNLRQLSLSMLLYGGDNTEKLPVQTIIGNWLWDLDWNVGNTLNKYGTPQENMYCPGTAPRFSAVNNEELYEYYATGNFHVIGYAPTLPNSPTLALSNVNATLTPQPLKPAVTSPYTIPPEPASQRVLVADATITHPGITNFAYIPGAYRVPHISPHLDGFIPAGGNVAMLDGHVQWRNFSQMQLRTTSGAQTWFYW